MSESVSGYCTPEFEGVREAFQANFDERGELGASVAVVKDGQLVVDLWAGFQDSTKAVPWAEDTLVNVWSLGKAMSALATLIAVDEGHLDLATPVACYWPEFAHNGKADITLATLLAHRAGLPALAAPLEQDSFFHWQRMAEALAAQKPWWPPDSAHGYHTNTFGFLLGETLRRATGIRLQDYFQSRVAHPLGVSFYMGVPTELLAKVADLSHAPRPASESAQAFQERLAGEEPLDEMRRQVYTNPAIQFSGPLGVNSQRWRTAEFPSTSPQSNARSVATVFGHLANVLHSAEDGIIKAATLREAVAIKSDGEDLVIGRPTRFGLGFQLTQPDRPLGPNPDTFGHYGNGGHIGFADPTVNMGFAYHMNMQGYAWRDPRNIALTDALYDCIDSAGAE